MDLMYSLYFGRYVIANHLLRQGNLVAVSQLFRTMLRFFTINHKEVSEIGYIET